ncbi:MAG TPA: MFS transporter [Solirubrobacteraceae bacterium]|nr:MFS transporter [Solirubrobacteraceae bacterium]
MIARYRALLSIPGCGRLLLSAVLGRLPSGMFSLAILLLVHARTGSFLDAGLAVGAFALAGAAMGPPLGALVDRVGQAPVLLPAAAVQAALLVALVLVARIHHAPVAAIVSVAALAGATQPPIAGCIRTLWSAIAPDQETLETAYTLDATTQEVIWTLGPLLVGTTAGLLSPSAAVLLCAAITLGGTAWFATSALSSGWQASTQERTRGGALASPGLRALLVTVALAGVVLGAIEVGLPALAVQLGSRWSSGPLLALFSVGSMAGGLLYSARSWSMALGRRYMAMLLAMAIVVAPLIAAQSLLAGFLLGALAGLGVAPMLSAQFSLVGALAASDTTTEAFAWHRAATIAGMAGGSALGGSLVDAHGAGGAFTLGCASVALAFALTVLWRRRIEPDLSGEETVSAAAVSVEPTAL